MSFYVRTYAQWRAADMPFWKQQRLSTVEQLESTSQRF